MREKLQKMINELRLIADASDKGGHEVSTDCLRTFADELESILEECLTINPIKED